MTILKAFLDDPLKCPRDYIHLEVPLLGSVCLYPLLLSIPLSLATLGVLPSSFASVPVSTWWFSFHPGETKGGFVILFRKQKNRPPCVEQQ